MPLNDTMAHGLKSTWRRFQGLWRKMRTHCSGRDTAIGATGKHMATVIEQTSKTETSSHYQVSQPEPVKQAAAKSSTRAEEQRIQLLTDEFARESRLQHRLQLVLYGSVWPVMVFICVVMRESSPVFSLALMWLFVCLPLFALAASIPFPMPSIRQRVIVDELLRGEDVQEMATLLKVLKYHLPTPDRNGRAKKQIPPPGGLLCGSRTQTRDELIGLYCKLSPSQKIVHRNLSGSSRNDLLVAACLHKRIRLESAREDLLRASQNPSVLDDGLLRPVRCIATDPGEFLRPSSKAGLGRDAASRLC